jgi:hypothetical protein
LYRLLPVRCAIDQERAAAASGLGACSVTPEEYMSMVLIASNWK